MQKSRFSPLWWLSLLLFLNFLIWDFSPKAATSSSPSDLAGTLLRKHAYLFDDHQREQLDAVNRELREAEAKGKGASSSEKRKQADRKYEAAVQRLLNLLGKCPDVVRIDLAGHESTVQPNKAILLPGNIGALLFRVVAGEGQAYFRSLDYSMAVAEHTGPINIENQLNGTTWVLITLFNVPVSKSALLLEFRGKDSKPVLLPIELQTPQPARLKINILSSDTEEPTPAMVRLVWMAGGIDYKPANAVEFTAQFEGQGNTSSYRPSDLPGGGSSGGYWCVPGPFEMTVPPGKWEIAIRRGLEHISISDTLTLESGKTLEKTYTLKRWVDMPRRGWYSGDDHVHFRILSDDDARRLMAWVQAEDLHVANVVRMGDIARTYFEQRGFGKEYRIIAGDYILSPGQEDPRTHGQSPDFDIGALGHVLAMNTTGHVRDTSKYYLYDWMFDAVHGQGGLTGYAHVASNAHYPHRDMSINVPKNKVDFVEVLQSGHLGTELYYEFLNLGFKLTASAGSDVPFGGTVGDVRVYAYTGEQVLNADPWFEGVRRGRTFVSNGLMIEFSVDGELPGGEIVVKENRKVQVKARTWGDPERLTPSRLEIVCHGEVIRHTESEDPNNSELSIGFELDAENGFWIAARAEGSDGSRAHTTPIYVIRQPLRFWNYNQVEGLIDKRLASLGEVERMVLEAKRLNKTRGMDNRARTLRVQSFFELRSLALQASELLKRVAAAKQLYETLRDTFRSERSQRAFSKQ